jgi:hypothetical protein
VAVEVGEFADVVNLDVRPGFAELAAVGGAQRNGGRPARRSDVASLELPVDVSLHLAAGAIGDAGRGSCRHSTRTIHRPEGRC